MQRGIASLLTVLFGWLLLLPAVAFYDRLILPACCRTNGKHHCLMSMSQGVSSANTVSALAPKCPFFPQAAVAAHTSADQPSSSGVVSADLIGQPAASSLTEAWLPGSYSHSPQERAPPRTFS